MTANDRVARMEEKVDKLDMVIGEVKVEVGKISTRLDVVLDSHEKRICQHETEIKEIRSDVEKSKFFGSATGKILAIILALIIALIPTMANYFISRKQAHQITSSEPAKPYQP